MLKPLHLFSSLKFVPPFLHLQHSPTPPRFLLHSTASPLTRVPSNFARASSSFMQPPTEMDYESYMFGPYKIDPREVFYSTELSYALVRPLVPGVKSNAFLILVLMRPMIYGSRRRRWGANLSPTKMHLHLHLQSKMDSDWTDCSTVHIHILPRKSGDFEKNDEIFDAIDLKEKELKQKLDLDKESKDRSIAEMTEEADVYRKLFL